MSNKPNHNFTALPLVMAMIAVSTVMSALLLGSCGYDENMETCLTTVRLLYPKGNIGPHKGVQVELIDGRASIFIDSTDAEGIARFQVPPGIYEARSYSRVDDQKWRYYCNGIKSMNVISPDSTNQIDVKLYISKKRKPG